MYESSPMKWRDTILPETANAVVRMMVKTVEMGTSHRTFGTPERTPLLQTWTSRRRPDRLRVDAERALRMVRRGRARRAPRLALAALVVNDNRWKIKGGDVGKEAFNSYFGYPSSMPPVYAKARGSRKWTPRRPARRGRGGRRSKRRRRSPGRR